MVLKIGEIGNFRLFNVNSRNNAPKNGKIAKGFNLQN
jgi:hypothetical protein